MKPTSASLHRIQSISEHHRLMAVPAPRHPLVSLINYKDVPPFSMDLDKPVRFTLDFYTLALKKECTCKIKYGQHHYDYDQGVMFFAAPDQVLTWAGDTITPPAGWLLTIHPDLLRGHPLGQKIKEYGFFNYALHEALHLSEQEETLIDGIFDNIHQETDASIDTYSQDVLLSYLDLLLNYANRFYNRQFITRKHANTTLLTKLDALLTNHINGNAGNQNGIPTVRFVADQMNLSPAYLSDLVKKTTGRSAQQYIHAALIDRAKELLTSSELSVGEIAYALGFEHPQSFNKLFKQKTNTTPLAFRQSSN